MTIPLFTDDQIPACDAGPIVILRRMEAKLEALKTKLAATEDPTYDDGCWDAGRLKLDPDDYEELYNEARAYEAMQWEIEALEAKLPAAQEAALAVVNAHKETDR